MSIKKVIDWVNADGRTLWWREAIRLALANGSLSDFALNDLYIVACMEAGSIPKDEEFATKTSPVQITGFDTEDVPVKLISISNVQNVSNLVNDQVLKLNEVGLTAIYGDNGSGKSSYAKILKNACLTRGDSPQIITNIYSPSTDPSNASLTIRIGQNEPNTVNWLYKGEQNEDLKSIRVFDSNSAIHYISKEDTVEYKPTSLKLLGELTRACEFIKAKVANEKTLISQKKYIPICIDGTKAKEFIDQLSYKTTNVALDNICASQDEIDSIEGLQKELLILQTTSPLELREKFKEQYKKLEPLSNHLELLKQKLSDASINEIQVIYEDLLAKIKTAELARKQKLEGHPIDGICSQAWQEMWRHVKEFIKSNGQGNSFPPVEGEHCPTCLQPINKETANRLIVFNDYLKDKTQLEVAQTKKRFEDRQKIIKELIFNIEPYHAILEAIKKHNPDIEGKIRNLNSALKSRANNIQSKIPTFKNLPIDFASLDWINQQISRFKTKEAEVKDDATLNLKITKDKEHIFNLQERVKISQNKQNILDEIERLKKGHDLDLVNNTCASSSVTSIVTSISRDGSIGQLNNTFNKELLELGFNGFEVETGTRGAKGQQLLKLQLKGKKNRISEIASEGEQKCISLAGFLAELIVDERKSAVIFDDPINSLDHKWRRKFADRIAKESIIRQVIVLTHDLSFLKMLEESIAKYASTIEIIAIRKHGQLSGYPLKSAPWDTLSTAKRISELKKSLQELAVLSKNPDPDSYIEKTRLLYAMKRDTWERLVEEWLLKGVVERFGRDVKTQNIRYLANGITSDDVKTIDDAMSKCSTFFVGHDRAHALGIDIPHYDEVANDIISLDEYFNQLKRRRSK